MLIGSFLIWGPAIALWSAFAAAAALYFFPRLRPFAAPKWFLALAAAAAAGRLLYAALASAGQYSLWAGNEFTKAFVAFPADARSLPAFLRLIPDAAENPLGYFLVYSWGRFWLNPLLAILVALAFYWFLKALERKQTRFFEEGETELGLLAALLAGWPGFVIFVPLAFSFVLLLSLVRRAVLKEAYTTLGIPLLLSLGATLLWGDALLRLFRLGVLWI